MSDRKAFTLIEVLVSIFLLSIVIFTLYKNLDIIRASDKQLRETLEASQKFTKIYKTLYLDLLQISDKAVITSKERDFDRICFYSTHSLYQMPKPYICYFIHKKENTLLRIETPNDSPSSTNIKALTQIDILAKNIEVFKIKKAKRSNKLLLYIKSRRYENAFVVNPINSGIKFRLNIL